MTMVIRQESAPEFGQIFDLVKVAFQTAKVSNGKEQDFATQLREGDGYIPELALVAEEEGALVGHIMLTRWPVVDGEIKHETLLLGPISVVLEKRGQGIGSKLIEESFHRAKALGFSSVVLVGDPAYYGRFGFKPSTDFGIGNTNGIPDPYVMAIELVPDALQKIKGSLSF